MSDCVLCTNLRIGIFPLFYFRNMEQKLNIKRINFFQAVKINLPSFEKII
jgi:hypothetical protein